jgi:tetratricopeptide (TPR) repeat protein
MLRTTILALTALTALMLLLPAMADDTPGGRAELDKGRQAYAQQQYAEALTQFDAAEQAARTERDAALLVECLRLRAAVQRDSGDATHAEQSLQQAADAAAKGYGESSPELAAVLEEVATGERAQARAEAALAAIEKAIKIREAQTGAARAGLARDLTLAAVLHQQAGQDEPAMELLKRAIQEWSLAQPGDPQCLPAIEALAGIYRDRSQYADAEPLLQRAVRMREAADGLETAELIPSVDSLAYAEFGLHKYPEAEAAYKRLLSLWEKNAGAEHPMVALTLDKIAEFYAFQHRYEEAGKAATAALELRAKAYIASLNQTGRVLLMEARMDDAADLYHRTVQIGDLAKVPDDVMDSPLRIYGKILREMKRDDEAAAVEKRVKDALLRKADREGRRPAPGAAPVK